MVRELEDQLSSERTPGSWVALQGSRDEGEKRRERSSSCARGLKYEAPSIWSNCSGVGPCETPPLTLRAITHKPGLSQQLSCMKSATLALIFWLRNKILESSEHKTSSETLRGVANCCLKPWRDNYNPFLIELIAQDSYTYNDETPCYMFSLCLF